MILLEALWKILRVCPVCGANAIKGKPCITCGAKEVRVVTLEAEDFLGLPIVK